MVIWAKIAATFLGFDFKKFFRYFIEHWKEILVIGMAVTIFYQNFFETRFFFGFETIPSLEKRLEKSENNLKTCVSGNELLSKTIDKRNEEIGKWKKISKGLEKKNAELANLLGDLRKSTDQQVEAILGEKAPDSCKASIEYLREGRKDLQW